jgi:hypothetical protein
MIGCNKSTIETMHQTAQPTVSLTQDPSIVESSTRTPVQTGIATLQTPTQMIPDIFELLRGNKDCQLPCWLGIKPGETGWESAQNIFDHLGASTEKYDGKYFTTIDLPGRDTTLTQISVVNNQIVDLINVGTRTIVNSKIVYDDANYEKDFINYLLPNLLNTLGKPNEVWLRTFPGAPEGGEIPYYLLLYYPSEGIIVQYSGNALEDDTDLQICPQKSEISLYLWKPDPGVSIQDILSHDLYLTAEDFTSFQKLDQTTDLSVDQFFQLFRETRNNRCLLSPRSAWSMGW